MKWNHWDPTRPYCVLTGDRASTIGRRRIGRAVWTTVWNGGKGQERLTRNSYASNS